ncbi:type II toxin-antitoxin system HicB family antitoxin [Desulfosporosinus lacus]|uniref:Predicted nuclease of the RNAse H fold, HicB family n=1 Tax=Desulfosporosinus lacus DSM 15449 TaxID=1121420 RepID=A0A1M6HCK8_9FIRM|nr:type II toxin-antitoxin system HicB family antitoxin [Desulfosporosinus lacus]KUO77207.1 MAG: antitoxin HicB [Desulfosporosinus sp. BRH_c37]SHJ19930.1 Predicted nuclease of the RNAse H fold, HicB family [Desulfosporosinus lacus DSM 15449]
MQRKFKVILEKNESGGFTVTVPELPGCVTQGRDRKEALEHVQEAIAGFLEALVIEGLPIPSSTIVEMDEVQVSY